MPDVDVAMRYLVYAFLGKRSGEEIVQGFKLCIYDSARMESSKCPSIPAIQNPVFQIEENTSGSLEFTLLKNGKTRVVQKQIQNGSIFDGNTEFDIQSFMKTKQTELVIYRYILKGANAATSLEKKEIWSGRLSSIRKDFYDNWTIFAEGELAYLNDFVMSEQKFEPSGGFLNSGNLFKTIINSYNKRVAVNGSSKIKVKIDKEYEVPELDRSFVINIVSPPERPKVLDSIDLEDEFSISDGTSYWSAVQSLLERYGGHLEITKNEKTLKREINWKQSGKYNDETKKYEWDGYNGINKTRQPIDFGVNLLDFSIEQENDELFTVLIPHGQASTITKEDEEGKTTTTSGPPIDISSVNKGSPYIYDKAKVEKYGWIEKVVTWNISNPRNLYDIAKAYYNDLHIDSKKIIIRAYDLKNLINNYANSSRFNKKLRERIENAYSYDALNLYDLVKINSYSGQVHLLDGDEEESMPIKGIKIPLDKFPTDTEYTITNTHARKETLAPSNITEKKKQELPPKDDEGVKDLDPVIPTDSIDWTKPVSGDLGIDDDLSHYPPIYLDRAFQYFRGTITEERNSSDSSYFTVSVQGTLGIYMKLSGEWYKDFEWNFGEIAYSDAASAYVTYPMQGYSYKTGYGYSVKDIDFIGGEPNTTTVTSPGSVFYSDDITNRNALMRIRKGVAIGNSNSVEQKSNYYEKVFVSKDKDEKHEAIELAPFVDSQNKYFEDLESACILGSRGQEWYGLYSGKHIKAPEINFGDAQTYKGGSYAGSEIINNIKNTSVLDTTVGEIFKFENSEGEPLIDLEYDELDNGYLNLKMTYKPDAYSEGHAIKFKLLPYKPIEKDADISQYRYKIGVLEIGDSAVLYLIHYKYVEEGTGSGSGLTDHEKDIEQKVKDSKYIEFGLEPGATVLDVEKIAAAGRTYYRTVTDSQTQKTYSVKCNANEPGAKETRISSATYNYIHVPYSDTDQKLSPGPPSGQQNNLRYALYRPFMGTGLLYELLEIRKEYGSEKLTSYDEAKKILNIDSESKAIASAEPLLIFTKTNVIGEDRSAYAIIPFSFNPYNYPELELVKENDKKYYMLKNVSRITHMATDYNTPIMIAPDTLFGTKYMFSVEKTAGSTEDQSEELVFTNNFPVPGCDSDYGGSTSPITIFTKCGGTQTKSISSNAFMRLTGDNYSSHAEATGCISKSSPFEEGPGWRGVPIQTEEHTNPDYLDEWYTGQDMKKKSDFKDYFPEKAPKDGEEYIYHMNTAGRQPVIMGDKAYIRIGPNLFFRKDDE